MLQIICMPLGIRNKAEMFDLLDALSKLPPDKISKNKWLTINNSGWGDRFVFQLIFSKVSHFQIDLLLCVERK